MFAIMVEAEFEFCVCDDYAAGEGVLVGDFVDLQGEGCYC